MSSCSFYIVMHLCLAVSALLVVCNATGETLREHFEKSPSGLQALAVIERAGVDVLEQEWQEPNWNFAGDILSHYSAESGSALIGKEGKLHSLILDNAPNCDNADTVHSSCLIVAEEIARLLGRRVERADWHISISSSNGRIERFRFSQWVEIDNVRCYTGLKVEVSACDRRVLAVLNIEPTLPASQSKTMRLSPEEAKSHAEKLLKGILSPDAAAKLKVLDCELVIRTWREKRDGQFVVAPSQNRFVYCVYFSTSDVIQAPKRQCDLDATTGELIAGPF